MFWCRVETTYIILLVLMDITNSHLWSVFKGWGKWGFVQPIQEERSSYAAFSFNDFIYVMG